MIHFYSFIPPFLFYHIFIETIQPGQSFSFIANNVKGQQLKDQNVAGAKAIGAGGAAFDLNSIELDKD